MARSLRKTKKMLCNLCFLFSVLMLSSQAVFAEHALVIRGKTTAFEEVVRGMSEDLEGELTIEELIVSKESSLNDISDKFDKHPPQLVILIGNKAVNLYSSYQAKYPDKDFPPAIAMAALFIDKFIGRLQNATAIRYEVPAVTSFVAMRTILKSPIKRVGVVYREWMEDLIQENRKFLEAEGIELVAIKLPNKSGDVDSKVKEALKKLDKQTDALWILNDNSLLSKAALVKAWLPLRQSSSKPAIVGIKQFMTKFKLGSFAIVPDDYGLGAQAAGIIFEIMDNDWQIENTDVQQPVSVKKFINTKTLDGKGVTYKASKLNQVDEVIKK